MSGRTLLGVWAHPDDEAYLSAGLMATAADAGARVVVATATRGEIGTDDPQALLDKAEQLGGKTILPVTELPQVTIALFADPEGHVVGLAKGM